MKENVRVLLDSINKVIVGKEETIKKILVCLLSRGHILLEDVPGVGKTTIVNTLAKSLNMSFNRIQFTPDLLPSDVTGISIFNQQSNVFEFKKGPIYNNVVLADEINRTSPKTQSSLLEVMQEGQLTVDGVTYILPKPFIVLATQNPIEYEGTFPLPEAQLDRFMMKISIGYPDRLSEKEIIRRFSSNNPLETIESVLKSEDIINMQKEVDKIHVDSSIEDYIVDIITKTRKDKNVRLGVSPRGGIALYRAAKAFAYISDRSYVLPDDIKNLAEEVLSHRIILRPESKVQGATEKDTLNSILETTKVPVVKGNE
ncbi:AAA family ATPase [Sporosalibacterium faouarense]|uniref:AAA family ATPase n=1 Tax=Sporosalibacterium faouarense TaxID=516123 RepID=UPI00141C4E5B|nr:MoxR family ATPase [Sporosalibacterium faouarense]MTI46987.1 MoxR family ATPase [Bacillota bacterium]